MVRLYIDVILIEFVRADGSCTTFFNYFETFLIFVRSKREMTVKDSFDFLTERRLFKQRILRTV